MTAETVRWYRKLCWSNTAFLLGTPIAVFVSVPWYLSSHSFTWGWAIFFFVSCVSASLSITAGYHRLFAHKSYDASLVVRLYYLLFGAACFQGSALQWCSDHRKHHRHVDTDRDPYNIRKGVFFAHIGWLFLRADTSEEEYPLDLRRDPLVLFQHQYYKSLAFLLGFGVPAMVGFAMGSVVGGLLWGGLVRIVFTQHCTFLINSLCHFIGRQPFYTETSARDNWVLAVFTYGEGYHNYHHRFMSDYRNGIYWYQWDPTKWTIQLLAVLGLARKLKTIPSTEILKARMSADQERLLKQGVPPESLQALKVKVEEAQRRMRQLCDDYQQLKENVKEQSRRRVLHLKAELKVARLEFKMAWAQWGAYRRTFKALPASCPGRG